jgi:type II secretion system protein L
MAADLQIRISDRQVSVRNTHRPSPEPEIRRLPACAGTIQPSELAELIADAASGLGKHRGRATLVIPSSWCYVHRIRVPQRRPSRTALAYALEEHLPLDVEQLTCDFVRTVSGDHLGVAIETARLRPLLDALDGRSVHVDRITIDVLNGAPQSTPGGLIWCDEQHVTVFTQANGRPEGLRVIRLAADLEDDEWRGRIVQHLNGDQSPPAATAVAGCLPAQRLEALAESLDLPVAQSPIESTRASRAFADFDLARDELATSTHPFQIARTGRNAAAAVLIALLMLAVGMGAHRIRLQERMRTVAAWEQNAYTRLFPGHAVPTGVGLRLASERRRLEGLTLASAAGAVERVDAVETLLALVAALPADLRVNLQEIRIERADITVRGRTRDHRDAERLAAAIDGIDSLHCAAPRTDRRREGGVQFFLHARRAENAHLAQKDAP